MQDAYTKVFSLPLFRKRVSPLQLAMQGVSHGTGSSPSRLPGSFRRSMTVVVPACFTLWGYTRYQRCKFAAKALEVQKFHDDTLRGWEKSPVFKLDDRLYMMGGISAEELEEHRKNASTINIERQKVKKFRQELQQFCFLENLDKWQRYVQMVWSQNPVVPTPHERAHAQLNTTQAVISLASDVNLALYYLKKRFYPLADDAVRQALKRLHTTPELQVGFGIDEAQKTQQELYGHAYNIAAKIARSQDEFDKSDECYEKAKKHLPNNPIIVGSQIALWGDFAWRKHSPNPDKLKRFIADTTYFQAVEQGFQGYGLGLANLSWVLLQALEHKDILRLTPEQQAWCLQKAFALADQAVPRVEKSINARLFRGIAYMEKSEYSLALADFETALAQAPDHPSLLRRRAMALQHLGDPRADTANQQAQIELAFLLANKDLPQELQKKYQDWLEQLQESMPQSSPQEFHADQPRDPIVQQLMTRQYEQARLLLEGMPQEDAWVKTTLAWFERHFKMEKQKDNTYQLIPKIREDFLKRLGLYAIPTPYELMAMSQATYLAEKGHRDLGAPAGWTEIARSSPAALSRNGYVAVAFRRTGTRHVVISHGGTNPKDYKDLGNDVALARGKHYPQLSEAKQFVQTFVEALEKELSETTSSSLSSPVTIYYHTDHSLGGAIAAYLAITMKPIGRHYAVTFDNPGNYAQTNREYQQAFDTLATKPLSELVDFPITNYLTHPSFINCVNGPHLGRVICIQPTTSASTGISEQAKEVLKHEEPASFYLHETGRIIQANLQSHDQDQILAAFSEWAEKIYSNLGNVYYVTAWPRNLTQWSKIDPKEKSSNDLPSAEGATDTYALAPAKAAEKGFRESIPLSMLGSVYRDLFTQLLKKKPLDERQKELAAYIDPYILSCMQLNDQEDAILLKGILSSGELFTYLRQQAQEACQSKLDGALGQVQPGQAASSLPKRPIAEVLYPELAKADQKKLPPKQTIGRWGGLFSAEGCLAANKQRGAPPVESSTPREDDNNTSSPDSRAEVFSPFT